MVVAIIAGILVGIVSLVHSLNLLGPFLLTIAVSFIILIAGLVVCKLAAPDVIVAFAFAELVAFVVGVIAFGIYLSKRR